DHAARVVADRGQAHEQHLSEAARHGAARRGGARRGARPPPRCGRRGRRRVARPSTPSACPVRRAPPVQEARPPDSCPTPSETRPSCRTASSAKLVSTAWLRSTDAGALPCSTYHRRWSSSTPRSTSPFELKLGSAMRAYRLGSVTEVYRDRTA